MRKARTPIIGKLPLRKGTIGFRLFLYTEASKRSAEVKKYAKASRIIIYFIDRSPHLVTGNNIELISLQFLHRQSFTEKIEQLSEEYDILAIVGTVQFEYNDIPYFSLIDIFNDDHLKKLNSIICKDEPYSEMIQTLENHLTMVPSVSRLVQRLRKVIVNLELQLNVNLKEDIVIGMILHMAFLVENMKLQQPGRIFPNMEEYYNSHKEEIAKVKEVLKDIEIEYDIKLTDGEIAYICQMCLENQQL
ncbi:PRD domain-containing protein [Ferdinandcohnia quinoae]|nr:PRD domain-containing protein [Fredinandcohnia sp. SECRCQ15]